MSRKEGSRMSLHTWSLRHIAQAVRSGEMSAVTVTRYFLQRIDLWNSSLKAFIISSDNALEQAAAMDALRNSGKDPGPLAGVPIAIKDLLDTEGIQTTYGGRHHVHIPDFSAPVVTLLQQAGAIVIGKTNLHEYAYGTTTENPHYGISRNPWNINKISGGSSGGNGVALAAGLCLGAVGTDTGGSIRIPAALCGTVGLKPTYGLVSKRGVFPLAKSLDHVGPMANSVADVAVLLSVLAGYDSLDPDSCQSPARKYPALLPQTLRIGLPKQYFYDRCHPNLLQVIQTAFKNLREHLSPELNHWVELEIPLMVEVPEAQRVLITSEARAVHNLWLKSHPALYGEDVRTRLMEADDIRGDQYVWAAQVRRDFTAAMEQVFEQVDVLLTPTTPIPATNIGQVKTHVHTHEVNVRSHLTRNTHPWNLTGLPALTIPCGFTHDGLPVGLQIIGPKFSEPKLLSIGKLFEQILVYPGIAPAYR
ncbi:amidase [Alicyclobacillaceae bacterium I2511]|nr:amidase [Alicyclobacillaceae bacterium I2511]